MRVINTITGMVQPPHPLFDSWADAVHHFAKSSDIGNYRGQDVYGNVFCGRVAHDGNTLHGVVELDPAFRVDRGIT